MIFAFVRRLLRDEGGLSPAGLALASPVLVLALARTDLLLPLL